MAQNEKLAELSSAGVAVWLDDLSRDRIQSGNLQQLVDEHSVVGVTTNPTIFAAAIHGSDLYNQQVHDAGGPRGERRRGAAHHHRRPTSATPATCCARSHDRQPGDGRVSLEVAPGLAHDTDATEAEAAHLWWLVDRPNLFIKIPATEAGLPAITDTIAKGISVNVTLIFSLERYRAVMEAYLSGLEKRVADGGSLEGIASVASFFVSPGRHRDRQAPRQGRRRRRRSRARRASPTRSWPTRPTRRSSPATAGRRWRRRAPCRSGRCGRRPASRTRSTRTRCTSASSSPRARSTRCPRRR